LFVRIHVIYGMVVQESSFTFLGKEYKTVEHFYQSAKAQREEDAEKIRSQLSTGLAKKLGQQIGMKRNWNGIKISVMRLGLILKFSSNEISKQKLIETGDAILEEGNNWNDRFWGIDLKTGEGKNILGKLIMELRKYFKNH